MPNYQLGKIYKIISQETEKIYIGSTSLKYLSERFAHHRCTFNNQLIHKISSAEILKFNDAKIILIETFPCNSKDELNSREQFWIDHPDYKHLCVNILKAYIGSDKKQYYKEQKHANHILNREENLKKFALYRKENKDKIQEKQKETYQCECGKVLTKAKKTRHVKTMSHIIAVSK